MQALGPSQIRALIAAGYRVLPIEACGPRTHELIRGSEYVPIQGAPHGLCWTHAEEVNAELLRFFK